MDCRIGFLAIALCSTLLAIPAKAENYAFLVAVQDDSAKNLKPLKFTRNDIQEFSKLLVSSGFKAENIVLMTDKAEHLRYAAEAEKIRKQMDMLLQGMQAKDTLIVAFAGHGVQFEGDERNYFCPADADLEDPKHSRLIALSEIYDKLKACPAQRKMLLVDACRKNPLSDPGRTRVTVNLQSVTRPQIEAVPKGVVALFSCAAGQEAFEWPGLKHGIFFHHVIEWWQGAADDGDRQVTLDEVVAYARTKTQNFARINLDVSQTPQLKSEFEGTWILKIVTSRVSPGLRFARSEFATGAYESAIAEYSKLLTENPQDGDLFAERALGRYMLYQEKYWTGDFGPTYGADTKQTAVYDRFRDDQLATLVFDLEQATELAATSPRVSALRDFLAPRFNIKPASRTSQEFALEVRPFRDGVRATQRSLAHLERIAPVNTSSAEHFVFFDPTWKVHEFSPEVRAKFFDGFDKLESGDFARYSESRPNEAPNRSRLLNLLRGSPQNRLPTLGKDDESKLQDELTVQCERLLGRKVRPTSMFVQLALSDEEMRRMVDLKVKQRSLHVREKEYPVVLNPDFTPDENWLKGLWYMSHVYHYMPKSILESPFVDAQLAETLATKAMETSPRSMLGLLSRGWSRFRQDKLSEALSDFGEVIRARPNSFFAYDLRARVHAQAKDQKAADEDSAMCKRLQDQLLQRIMAR